MLGSGGREGKTPEDGKAGIKKRVEKYYVAKSPRTKRKVKEKAWGIRILAADVVFFCPRMICLKS